MSNWRTNHTLDNCHFGVMAGVSHDMKELEKKMEESTLDSMVEINVSQELYKKKEIVKDDSNLEVPFKPLIGESPLFLGSTTDGPICLTDYRLCVSVNPLFTIPLGLIEFVDCRDNYHLYIHCKNAQTSRCTFSDNSVCQMWVQRIQAAIVPNPELQECFSFLFYSWCRDEKTYFHQRNLKCGTDAPHTKAEADRMGFGSKWKISTVNADYSLCPSYPRFIILPCSVPDDWLKSVANFRHSRRIPVVVWRHQKNGCIIARSSQPKVGFFGSPCKEDEALIKAILEASEQGSVTERQHSTHDLLSLKSDSSEDSDLLNGHMDSITTKMLVIDARSYTAAFANRAKGGGTEVSYPNCEVVYQNLANIHGVRRSFQSLRTLCSTAPDPALWLSSLEATRWLSYVGSLINAALQVVHAVDNDNRDVLVHCSDGWDRTPQIVALAELMMDPYYRTRAGFQVLVEREWLEFGHKFADRCGNSPQTDDPNERSPVFLQWLDCVFQILAQFPSRFEFNEQYLVKLVYHTYSNLFGTFLCNTDQERRSHAVSLRTYSVWSHLNRDPNFYNHLYKESNEVLKPIYLPNALKFWNAVYFLSPFLSSGTLESDSMEENAEKSAGISLAKKSSKSCEDLPFLCHTSGHHRRSSDTSIVEFACAAEKTEALSESMANRVTDFSKSANHSNIFVNNCADKRTKNCSNSNGGVCESNLSKKKSSTDTLVLENAELEPVGYTNPALEEFEPSAMSDIKNVTSVIFDYLFRKGTNSSGVSSTGSATPHHSRSSSGIPSSPCDEYGNSVLTRGSSAPQHILDIDGSIITRDEIQLQAWRKINLRDEKIRRLEKELRQHAEVKAWILKHRKEFKRWLTEMYNDGNCLSSDNEASSLDDTSTDEQDKQSTGSEDFVKIEAQDILSSVSVHSQPSSLQKVINCRNSKSGCSRCFLYQLPANGRHHEAVTIGDSKFRRQCRQSVQSCDKMPETVITATSN